MRFSPGVETKLMTGSGVVLVQQAGSEHRWSLDPQQTVNSLQLRMRQDETVELLLTARTRHHDPTHQHRVALLLLCHLNTDECRMLDLSGKSPDQARSF